MCALFERDLKEKNAHQRELTYDVQQLFTWIDHLVSACMRHDGRLDCCSASSAAITCWLMTLCPVQHDLSALVCVACPLLALGRMHTPVRASSLVMVLSQTHKYWRRFDSNVAAYLPYNKAWIKDRVLRQLRREAGMR